MGPSPDNQLYWPCKCSGSIKFVHQQCLLDWLQHSGRLQAGAFCEVRAAAHCVIISYARCRKSSVADHQLCGAPGLGQMWGCWEPSVHMSRCQVGWGVAPCAELKRH